MDWTLVNFLASIILPGVLLIVSLLLAFEVVAWTGKLIKWIQRKRGR